MAETSSRFPLFASSNADNGRYEVGELIAAGGMGTVHRGFDKLRKRAVAYKRILVSQESARPRMAALFQREYDTLTSLTHPNIVEAYDFGFDAHGPYYTMELLPGDHLGKLAPLPYREACRLLRDVASALALLHARRLVHRDVSPRNVLLSQDGRAKLLDFGALTQFGTPTEIVGTPAFIAPECLTSAPIDQRADLYALGALAYWLVTGHTHVRAASIDDLADALQEPLLAPSRYVLELPSALDELVLSLLQTSPSARPSSAADVIEQLTTIARLEPEQEPQRVAYSYLQRPPLVGREPLLAPLRQALERARAGAGQLVLLEAEPGLGRSALLDQLAVEAQLAGALVLRAGGGLHTFPFAAAYELVQTGIATFPSVGGLMRERSSQFVHVLGGSDGTAPAAVRSAIDAADRQAALSSLLEEALYALAACTPLVLLVDDAQGVDGESIALLASMAASLGEQRILLVLSAHPGQVASDLQARARLETSAQRMRLAPLTEAQVGQLISTTFGGVPNCQVLAAWLFAQAGGNPAHTMELARHLLAQGTVRYTLGTFTLPYELAQSADDGRAAVLRASVAQMSPGARKLADLLALHDGVLSSEELAHASGDGDGNVTHALDELVKRGVARARGDSFCCASEALRSAVVGVLSPEQTSARHVALARALAMRAHASLEAQFATADHLMRAGEAEQLEGAYLLARAAGQHNFELGTRPAWLRLLERALEILKRHGLSDVDCIGILVPLCTAGFYGHIAAQRRYLDRTLAALSSICGLTRARQLARWLWPGLALALGLIAAFFTHLVRRNTLTRRSFVEHLETLTGVTGPATAAAACSFDPDEAWRVVAWLEPLAAAPRRSPLFFMREFCVATAELVSAELHSASRRYATLIEVYARPVPGIDAKHAVQIRSGCLNGQGQTVVTDTSPEALLLADQLEQAGGGAFFAPHAESIRASYHAYRGNMTLAAAHRERAEALSLQAGTCWSAMSVLTVRAVLPNALTGDVIGLMRLVSDLEQMATLSDGLRVLHQLACAHLEVLRGDYASAGERYERAFADPVARKLPTYPVERALQAQALAGLGDHQAARALCISVLEELQDASQTNDLLYCVLRQQLALAEAELGQHARAAELVELCLARNGNHDNPFFRGCLHRDRAYVAALAGDRDGFEQHFAAMTAYFRITNNPWLIRQGDTLHAHAQRLGVRAPTPLHALGQPDELDGTTELARPSSPSYSVVPPPPASGRRSTPQDSDLPTAQQEKRG